MTFLETLKTSALLTENYLKHRFIDNKNAPPLLHEAMRYAVLNGGKRFRPFLVLECAGLFDVSEEQALPTAAALECIHCYSLVHDDLPAMDDDDLRRGQPTVHIAFDEATAILVGDGLLTCAFEILSEAETHPDPQIRVMLVSELAKAAGWCGMVGGQVLDLNIEKSTNPTLENIAQIQSMKTGALIRFACEAGSLLGNANKDERQALAQFGDKLGLAFQIADDLLDIEGNPETLGKATSKDEDAGKATFVSVMGINTAKSALTRLEHEAIECLNVFGTRASKLIEATHFAVKRNH